MTYAFRPARVTISGTSFGGTEIWSTGFYIGKTDADMGALTPGIANTIHARWKTFFQTTTVKIGSQWTTTGLKVALLNLDGSTDLDNIDYATVSPTYVGVGTTIHPPQISLVATLTSQIQRGLGAKGRMFLPGINHQIGSDGKCPSTDVTATLTALKTFFDGVNTDLAGTASVILASRGRTTPTPTAGVNAAVSGIRMGNVYDTQRRRRNALAETYTAQTLAGSF